MTVCARRVCTCVFSPECLHVCDTSMSIQCRAGCLGAFCCCAHAYLYTGFSVCGFCVSCVYLSMHVCVLYSPCDSSVTVWICLCVAVFTCALFFMELGSMCVNQRVLGCHGRLCSCASMPCVSSCLSLSASAHLSSCLCASSRVPVCPRVRLGWLGMGTYAPAPSHPAGRVDDSPCQALPLARCIVTYLWLLF